jgi:hypothetical protein
MLRTADYKDVKALKSCHTEFVHIHGAAFFSIKGESSAGSPFFSGLLLRNYLIHLLFLQKKFDICAALRQSKFILTNHII